MEDVVINRGKNMQSNLFNSMFEQSAIPMIIAKIEGDFLHVNDAFCDFTGYSREELLSETFIEITHPNDLQMNLEKLEKLIAGEIQFYQMEKRYIHKLGHVVWGSLSVNLIYETDGTPKYIMGQIEDITEKKEIEVKLLESEQKYRLITENSSDRIITITPEGKYHYISPSLENQLGYKIDELLGKGPIDLVHNKDKPLLKKAVQVVLESQLSIIVTYRIRHKKGHYLWTEANIKCIKDNKGKRLVLMICREITERKEIEMKLQQSTKKVNTILESISDGFFSLDDDDRFIFVNRSALQFLGRRKEEIIGYKMLDVFSSASNLVKNYLFVKAKKIDMEFEMYIDFLGAWFTVRMYHSKDLVSIYLVDITKQKRLEMKLLESEERYRSLVELSPETISVQADEKFVFMNPAGYKLLGATKESEIIGKSVWSFFPEDEHQMVRESMEQLDNGEKKSILMRQRNLRVDGTIIDVSATITKINYDGKPAIQAIVHDITEIQKMEEWMRKTEKLSLVGQLAAGVAHEIRNPMTSIKGFIQLAKSTKELKESFIDIILSELNRTEAIIYEFLALAKPNEMSSFKPNNINDVLSQVIQLLEAQALMYDVNIMRTVPDKELLICCDVNQMKQVFINIIQNAIEASNPKSNIYISTFSDENNVYVEIKDEGCGIPEKRLNKIGEPFYSTKEKGTGLGLLVTFKIIEAHNGKLNFSSEQGRGTTVEVSIPRHIRVIENVEELKEIGNGIS